MDHQDDGPQARSSTPRGDVRDRMVEGAVRLLATRGVEGTSFAGVLAATGSPRGSVYHHFPGGKPELLHAALDLASQHGLAAMEATRGQPAAAVIGRFLSLWQKLLERSALATGCAVVAVTVAAGDDDLLDHAGTVFRTWTSLLTELCAAGGTDPGRARRLAVTVIAATEGAVAMCRAERSMDPFHDVAAVLLDFALNHPVPVRGSGLALRAVTPGRPEETGPPVYGRRGGRHSSVLARRRWQRTTRLCVRRAC